MSGVSHFAMVGYDVVLSGGSQISQIGGAPIFSRGMHEIERN